MTPIERLRSATNWLRQGPGDWKSVVNEYDRTPYEAADLLEEALSALERAAYLIDDAERDTTWTAGDPYSDRGPADDFRDLAKRIRGQGE